MDSRKRVRWDLEWIQPTRLIANILATVSLDFQSVTIFFGIKTWLFVITSEIGAAAYDNGVKKSLRKLTRINTWFPEQYRIHLIWSIHNTYFNVYSYFRLFYKMFTQRAIDSV